jgi:hypothetical protein
MDSMEQVRKVLLLWNDVSNILRVRDRSVKVIQYGCQMLIGYYGNVYSKEAMNTLALTRRTASTSRKAFWLAKSMNHLYSIVDLLFSIKEYDKVTVIQVLNILEQLFLLVYYFCENIVFCIRVNLLQLDESSLDTILNGAWFWSDLIALLAAMIDFIYRVNLWKLWCNNNGRSSDSNSNSDTDRTAGTNEKTPHQPSYVFSNPWEWSKELVDSSINLIIVSSYYSPTNICNSSSYFLFFFSYDRHPWKYLSQPTSFMCGKHY